MGALIDASGWKYWSVAALPFALLGAGLAATLWNAVPERRRVARDPLPVAKAS